MTEQLLRALAPLYAARKQEIQVLVPVAGSCPVEAPGVREVVLPAFRRWKMLWDHWTVPAYANRLTNAVFYNPSLIVPPLLWIPGFATVHDFLYFPRPSKVEFREYALADTLYFRAMLPGSIRRSRLTHLVSRSALQDARELFPNVSASRYRVIPHGVDARFWDERSCGCAHGQRCAFLDTATVDCPYVLYVGALSRRKNVTSLLRAFQAFSTDHPEYSLVLISGSGFPPDPGIAPLLQSLPASRVRVLPGQTRERLRDWYQHAACFVFPSLYEGFGLPPLEAQASSCPVVCSHASSLPEVVGEGALLFDPREPAALVRHMETLTHETERVRLIAAGLRNASRFSWSKTAESFLETIMDVYRGSPA